jgi:methylase of polypeptide subunit release factors
MKTIELPAHRVSQTNAALIALLETLKLLRYRFVTPTPATHARFLARTAGRQASDLRDILGWSLQFDPQSVSSDLLALLKAADALEPIGGGQFKSRYRVSSMGDDLFLHSAYPTLAEDAVFFGPDSYRIADHVTRELSARPPEPNARLVDIGAGAGVGAIAAARLFPELRIVMSDINPAALRLARINAQAASVDADFVEGTNLSGISDPIDLALANPPYIIDAAGRDYRDGGDMLGAQSAYDMTVAAIERLAPGGRFILYTGSAIVAGQDRLRERLFDLVAKTGDILRYDEIDPDVFGEELDKPPYAAVERIALIAAIISRPASSAG